MGGGLPDALRPRAKQRRRAQPWSPPRGLLGWGLEAATCHPASLPDQEGLTGCCWGRETSEERTRPEGTNPGMQASIARSRQPLVGPEHNPRNIYCLKPGQASRERQLRRTRGARHCSKTLTAGGRSFPECLEPASLPPAHSCGHSCALRAPPVHAWEFWSCIHHTPGLLRSQAKPARDPLTQGRHLARLGNPPIPAHTCPHMTLARAGRAGQARLKQPREAEPEQEPATVPCPSPHIPTPTHGQGLTQWKGKKTNDAGKSCCRPSLCREVQRGLPGRAGAAPTTPRGQRGHGPVVPSGFGPEGAGTRKNQGATPEIGTRAGVADEAGTGERSTCRSRGPGICLSQPTCRL